MQKSSMGISTDIKQLQEQIQSLFMYMSTSGVFIFTMTRTTEVAAEVSGI